MKLAVAVRADKNIKGYTQYTLPIMEKFCSEWNAKLELINGTPPVMTDDNKPHYRIMEVGSLLDRYDRVLCLDADMVILPACPNPFDTVDEDKIGSIFEDVGSRKQFRRRLILNIQKHWGFIGWVTGYTNAGTFVVSRIHKPIFESFKGKYWTGWGSADLHLSYLARKNNFKIQELPFKWNHMTMFSEPWNKNANRFESYIIHYAGAGKFRREESRLRNIDLDIKHVYGKPK